MENYVARLLGHAFGDGYIHATKYYFIYTNKSKDLINEVKDLVMKCFPKVSICKRYSIGGIPQLQFSAKVGRFLQTLGAPKGAKSKQSTRVPQIILYGDTIMKREFLGALCDDEAEIRTNKDCRQITLKAAKLVKLEKELDCYLRQLKQLFYDLGIKCSEPKSDRVYRTRRGEDKIVKRIWITGHDNLILFAKKIPISNREKLRQIKAFLQAG